MKAKIESALDARILDELFIAAEELGAGPADMAVPLNEMYDVLERFGADAYLLAIAATWGDGYPWTEDDDAATLGMLRAWNEERRAERV